MISLLQVFRGIAAMLVVYHHANQDVTGLYGENTLRSLFDFGDAGVQFFFVLSGFIIYYVHRQDLGKKEVLGAFFKKRIIRVYPLYILVTLILTPFWAFVPGFGAEYHKHLSSFIYSLLLIPQSHVPNLGVGWTLTHEILFYCLFSLLVLSRAIGRVILGGWFVAIVVANLMVSHEMIFPLSHLFSVNNFLFGMGMLGAIVVLKSPLKRDIGWPMVFLGVAVFLAVAISRNLLYEEGGIGFRADRAFIVLLGLASLLIVLQSGSRLVENRMGQWRLLNLIGAASFSIYLTHQTFVSLLRKLVVWTGLENSAPAGVMFLLACLLSIAGGVVIYHRVEKPMLSYLHRRYLKKPRLKASEPAHRGNGVPDEDRIAA